MPTATQATAVPNSAVMNGAFGASSLMACKPVTLCGGGSRSRALMMKVEKAKKTPPTIPLPIAATVVR